MTFGGVLPCYWLGWQPKEKQLSTKPKKLWRGYAHFPEKFAALGASFELTEPSGEQVKGYAVAEFGH